MVFGILDYCVLVFVLLFSAAIGIYFRFTGNRQKSNDEFLLANKSMSMVPVAFSLMASFMSSITLLGVSNENYLFGTQFVVINLSYGLATPIACYLFLPVFYKLQAASAYEYLGLRFGRIARLFASIAFSLQMILYMGIVLYAPSLALESTTGIDKELAIIIIGITVLFYCCLGGIKTVLYTDIFQSLLMFIAVFIVIISGVVYAGGIENIFREADKGKRLELWNFDPDPTVRHTWFTLTIGGMFTYLTLYAVNQTQVQRLMTVKSLKSAQNVLWWSWPILTLLSFTTSFSGLVIYYYYRHCDPLKAGRITKADQIMPIYVVDALGHIPGVCGLFVAGIFSATLSTLSSCLNSLAAVTLEDYVKPLFKLIFGKKLELSESHSAIPSKIIAAAYGIICILMAFIAKNFGGILQISLTIFGAVGGPLLGLFTLGMATINANEIGSCIGLIAGIFFSLWIGFADKPQPQPLKTLVDDCSNFNMFNVTQSIPNITNVKENLEYFYLFRLSYWYTVVIGFLITVIIGYATSLLFVVLKCHKKDKVDIDRGLINFDLFFPPIANKLKKKYATQNNKEQLISKIYLQSFKQIDE
ncbi:hypothetical protein PVAND_004065 [Polypedilum vanderplanki]|uniref:Sodium-dependent multivitamin transporter n=1 Tax=Polypedilum vanderplanki TaxID=319348 RepID=A0A9J6BXY9_POLVA|nr:hypothetical protein PVAND_004065 [Polypedilum vanderplanki]